MTPLQFVLSLAHSLEVAHFDRFPVNPMRLVLSCKNKKRLKPLGCGVIELIAFFLQIPALHLNSKRLAKTVMAALMCVNPTKNINVKSLRELPSPMKPGNSSEAQTWRRSRFITARGGLGFDWFETVLEHRSFQASRQHHSEKKGFPFREYVHGELVKGKELCQRIKRAVMPILRSFLIRWLAHNL